MIMLNHFSLQQLLSRHAPSNTKFSNIIFQCCSHHWILTCKKKPDRCNHLSTSLWWYCNLIVQYWFYGCFLISSHWLHIFLHVTCSYAGFCAKLLKLPPQIIPEAQGIPSFGGYGRQAMVTGIYDGNFEANFILHSRHIVSYTTAKVQFF